MRIMRILCEYYEYANNIRICRLVPLETLFLNGIRIPFVDLRYVGF